MHTFYETTTPAPEQRSAGRWQKFGRFIRSAWTTFIGPTELAAREPRDITLTGGRKDLAGLACRLVQFDATASMLRISDERHNALQNRDEIIDYYMNGQTHDEHNIVRTAYKTLADKLEAADGVTITPHESRLVLDGLADYYHSLPADSLQRQTTHTIWSTIRIEAGVR